MEARMTTHFQRVEDGRGAEGSPGDLELEHELIERAARNGRLNVFIPSEVAPDPFVEVADANPERVNNGCQIYKAN
jgi:hypothetical protein